MLYEITDDCVVCGVCTDECPSGAIEEGYNTYMINHHKCTDCGICLEICPTEAIIIK